jgi:hypothetical protein
LRLAEIEPQGKLDELTGEFVAKAALAEAMSFLATFERARQ